MGEMVSLEDIVDFIQAQASNDDSGSGSGTGSGTDSGDDSWDGEGCQHVFYEANDVGLREWCEDGCMLAGGKAVGPYQTDRGTEKTHCETKDWDTGDMFCDPVYLVDDAGMGETRCDTYCGPFGGYLSDNEMGWKVCDWSEGTDPMGRCPLEWQVERPNWDSMGDGMTTECDTYCLGQGGHYEWNEEGEYDECVWSNISRYIPLFPEDEM